MRLPSYHACLQLYELDWKLPGLPTWKRATENLHQSSELLPTTITYRLPRDIRPTYLPAVLPFLQTESLIGSDYGLHACRICIYRSLSLHFFGRSLRAVSCC